MAESVKKKAAKTASKDKKAPKKAATAKKAAEKTVSEKKEKAPVKEVDEVDVEDSQTAKKATTAEKADVDIMMHSLVPKHEIMQKEEVDALLAEYAIEMHQLPKIRQSDPVAEQMGATIGDVLRITRNSATAGETVYYRVVVED